MSFDDNYHPSTPLGTFLDRYLDHEEDFGAFDPAPVPFSAGSQGIQRIISDNAAWLQAEPRTLLSIISWLFPGSVRRMQDVADMAAMIGGYLWDAGYTARDTEIRNPTWHWLEGQRLPANEAR